MMNYNGLSCMFSLPSHPHGIKVRLTSGQVGRVQAVVTPGE
ncbi:DUF2196 domain-containing protein [Deinococcus sp. UR1]|nr:DUF2196 domain-containing protein [Deinococcus sp. UR1]